MPCAAQGIEGTDDDDDDDDDDDVILCTFMFIFFVQVRQIG
jgi:hypothetical protein